MNKLKKKNKNYIMIYYKIKIEKKKKKRNLFYDKKIDQLYLTCQNYILFIF